MREPLLLPLIAIAAGILLGQYADFGVRESLWPALAFVAMACVPASKWLRATTIALALIFAGAFLIAVHRPTREPLLLVDGHTPGSRETVVASGCVVEPTVFSSDGSRFTLELDAGARVLVTAPKVSLRYGQRVEIDARFRAPRSFLNPGAFDYGAYLARRDTHWTALVPSNGDVRVLTGECGERWRGWVFAIRTAALERIESLYPNNPYAAAMMEAVLIGESTNLERVWTEDFRRTGTFHALVISGIHVSVLAGCLLMLLRFTPLNVALLVTAASAWLYAMVSGFTAPVVRAAAGFTLYLIARMLYRRVRPLNLLSAIAIAYLAWDPMQLFEASFQLSFLSVAAIGAFAAPWLERTTGPLAQGMRGINELNRDPHVEPRAAQLRVELRLAAETVHLWTRIPTKVAAWMLATFMRLVFAGVELTTLSLCVQVGLALPMAIYFHRISFTGLSANLLIVPLMNLLVPVGFFAIFTNSHWAAMLGDTLLRWSAAIAKWHAAMEPSWRVPDPPLWLAVALAAAVLLGAFTMRRNVLRWPVLAAVTALLILLVRSPFPAQAAHGELELTAIDVGQGDSLLLVFPQGATMLIDGGGRLEYGTKPQQRRSNLDIGEDVVSTYLWSRGIRHIDVIAATHAHQDHVGGLRALVENFHPAELWTGANPPPALVAQAKRQGARVVEGHASSPFAFSGAMIEVLAPAQDYVPMNPGNNDSLVLRVTYGDRAFLLMGDLERQEEYHLLGRALHADVLKVGHHGSKTSTTQEFLDAVAPSIAVISAGYENSFGHPHPDVLARLNERHTTILRTDRFGLATVRTNGHWLTYDLEAWDTRKRSVLPLGFPDF